MPKTDLRDELASLDVALAHWKARRTEVGAAVLAAAAALPYPETGRGALPAATWSVTQLIEALEPQPTDAAAVAFFRDQAPRLATEPMSWRGVYAELTLDSVDEPEAPTLVGELVRELRQAAAGYTDFTGYKGGSYLMHPATPIWADPHGRWENRAIVGVSTPIPGIVAITTAVLPI